VEPSLLERVISAVEPHIRSRLSAFEFEMAYQTRVAMDRIRFALKNTEQLGIRSDQVREANLQLLDALDRLESADRHFQARFRAKASTFSETNTELVQNCQAAMGKH
jgi:hypothetical protein